MTYRIWFKVDGYSNIELPVNPQDVTITYPGNPTNYDVEGVGEIIVPRIPKLATVTFESFFPRERMYQSLSHLESWYTPEWYLNFFRNVQRKRQPFGLTISRGYDDLNVYNEAGGFTTERTDYFDTVFDAAVLLDISITDKGGEPGDLYYNMTISEYRDASPKTLAELANETVDEDGNVLSQEMVVVVNRPPQSGAIVVGRTVQINGKVYEQSDSTEIDWRTAKGKANQVDAVVTRTLPPSVSGTMHSSYISGLGWVDNRSCKLAEDIGTANNINRIVTNNYD